MTMRTNEGAALRATTKAVSISAAFAFAALSIATAACGGDDDGTMDAGRADGGPRVDGGPGVDGGPALDGGADVDGGGELDGGVDASMPARARLMYVSVGGGRRVGVAVLDEFGMMTARADWDVTLPNDPGAMTYARAARRLYVGMGGGGGGAIATLALDTEGRPSLLGTTTGTGNPVYLSTAHDDSVLVTAYFGDDRLKTHDASGMPPHAELDSVATSDEPHAALIGPTGARVYVPHRNGNTTHWYDVATDGTLTMGGALAGEMGVGPRHIYFTPSGAHAYVINEYADSVSAHRVSADGSLERFQTLSTLPMGFDDDMNTCADVHVTPDGRFVYGSNRGHDSLAMFSIGADGSLTSLGTVSTEARPRELDVSPDGRFVVAAGQDSGALQSYRIESDGTLTTLDRLDIGADPRWVIID